MPQNATYNRRIILAARPHGQPVVQDFQLEETSIPTPTKGQVLLRTLYLSVDPYMRQLMDTVRPVYAPSVQLGQTMVGGTVSRVVTSLHPQFSAGDVVLSNAGWQDYALSDGQNLTPLGDMTQPSQALGLLGMPAFTAYVGLLHIGRPKLHETVVVAAATGAVGSVVGQIAKLKGARVVGIAGGENKCRYAVDELGFDVCLDRHDPGLAEQLAVACPDGIDVYFENVGGVVFDAVIPLLNVNARIPVIGHIADYDNQAAPPGPNRLPSLMRALVQKRILMQGLIILDHYVDSFATFRRDMDEWVRGGQVKLHEHLVDGLENAPAAFIDLLQGRHVGKVVVRIAST